MFSSTPDLAVRPGVLLTGVYPARSSRHRASWRCTATAPRSSSGERFVSQILGGASAGTLPVQRLDDLELTINLKSAAALGLTMPPSLLAEAVAVLA